jgi:hypothetical protein
VPALDEVIEFGVGQRAIHLAVRFGDVAADVVGAEQHL